MSARGRGGGWVALQFVVMAAILVAGFVPPHWPHGAHLARSVVGVLLVGSGLGTAFWASRTLGRSFTPYPVPLETAELVDGGPYRLVRHPVYSAGLVGFIGYSLYTSFPALALTGVLALVWALKARVEERFLRERYPGYPAYAERTRFRLVPGVY